MRKREPMIQTMKAMEVRAQWSRLLTRVYNRETRVVVEKSGIPVAAVVSVNDLKRLQRLERQRAADFAVVDEIRAAFADEPDERIQEEVDKAIAEVRAENRAGGKAATPAS